MQFSQSNFYFSLTVNIYLNFICFGYYFLLDVIFGIFEVMDKKATCIIDENEELIPHNSVIINRRLTYPPRHNKDVYRFLGELSNSV